MRSHRGSGSSTRVKASVRWGWWSRGVLWGDSGELGGSEGFESFNVELISQLEASGHLCYGASSDELLNDSARLVAEGYVRRTGKDVIDSGIEAVY